MKSLRNRLHVMLVAMVLLGTIGNVSGVMAAQDMTTPKEEANPANA
jgi:hypothetical protein